MQKKIMYHAAIYLRLSRDDEDIDGSAKRESDSISSQRELARSFVREQPDMELFDIYIDDGYSGANFDRPDFKRMMADIENGNVNCVVVKDLSRFGRDYIEAGRFIQKTFPAFSVRFIAITDHYDSLTADQSTTSLVIPVKNFVNDSYCQDISEKVKSHQRVKREKVNYKVDKILEKPESEWFKVEGTHEAIISKEDYQNVQRLLKVDTRAGKGKEKAHMFSGLLFCGDCKEPMVRRINRYKGTEKIYYICSTRNRSEGCSRHSIPETDLKRVVFQIIRSQVTLLMDVNRQMQYLQTKEMNFEDVVGFDKEITRLRNEQEKYLELRAGLYEDLKTGIITQTDFKNFSKIYEKQYIETEKALTRQEDMLKKLFYNGVQSGVKLERLKETMQIATLDRDTLLAFVDRIEVYEEKKVSVQFCYQEEMEKMLVLSEFLSSQSEVVKEVI